VSGPENLQSRLAPPVFLAHNISLLHLLSDLVFYVFNVLVSRAIGDHQMPEDYKHNASIDATILMLLRLRNASQPLKDQHPAFNKQIFKGRSSVNPP
jgi:hypothetical protein